MLVAATGDVSADVVSEAVRLLGYAKAASSSELRMALVRSLNHDSGEVRRLAARTIGWRGETELFEHVQPLLNDHRPGVREAAVRAWQPQHAGR